MNYLSELKRRNVFKVAVAYLVLGWVILQVLDVVSPILELPDLFSKIVLTSLAILFPVTLIITWAFELTPDGVKKTTEVVLEESTRATTGQKINYIIIGLMAIAITFLLYDRTAEPDEVVIVDATLENTLAVMPFADMSADGSQEYFGDGIAEEILNVLVKVDDLDVTSRTSSFAYKGTNTQIPDIAAELGVNYVLEGSIRSDGNTVRVTAQLIDVARDIHLWSETYDRELTSIFAIQDDISLSIANALRVQLVGDVIGNIPTKDIAAYDLYLRARQSYLERSTGEDLESAISFYEQAIALDDNFAEAWADLAASYILLPNFNGKDYTFQTVAPKANEAVNRAISINTNLSQAWAVKGYILLSELQFQDAQTALIRATELNDNNETAWLWLAFHNISVGYTEKATVALTRAIQLSPTAAINQFVSGMITYTNGDINTASILMDKVIDEMGMELARVDRAWIEVDKGNPEGAKTDMVQYYQNIFQADTTQMEKKLGLYANAYFDDTLKAKAVQSVQDDLDQDLGSFFGVYMMQNAEQIVGKYNSTTANKGWALHRIYYPLARPLFGQKLYRDYLISIGLLNYWKNNGFPNFCQALGEEDFMCE